MSAPEWRDVTSWSRGEKHDEPKTWELQGAPFRVVVTRHRDVAPDAWVLRAHDIGIDMGLLTAKTADNAKREAIGIVMVRLQKWHAAFSSMWEREKGREP